MNLRKIAIIALIVSLWSCSDDEGFKYEFQDQDASGKIVGDEWTYAYGKARNSIVNGKNFLDISLMLPQTQEGCNIMLVEDNYVAFSVPADVDLHKVGSNDVWAYFTEAGGDHTTVGKGAIEILSITDTYITGRVDIPLNKSNFVNGNFTVVRCN